MVRRVFWIIVPFLMFISLESCTKDDFKWNLPAKPEISDPVITQNSISSFTIQSFLISNGYDKETIKGFCWSSSGVPTINDAKYLIEDSKEESFTHTIPWDLNVTLYVRSFAKNKLEIVYSDVVEVNWTGSSSNTPIVNTLNVENIQFFQAKVNCQIISNGGLNLLEKGILISENPFPNVTNSIKILDNSNDLTYSMLASNLLDNKTYYVRAFARNFAFTGLGGILSFTTTNFYNIGEIGPAGGRIFYTKTDSLGGWNFLEAAPNDYNSLLKWSPSDTPLNNTETEIGQGELNSNSIISTFGVGSYAAYSGSIYVLNGYNDWFLPSRDELIKMHQNLYLNGIGNFVSGVNYWSSSEDDFYLQNAWSLKMSGIGEVSTFPKSNMFKSRYIRKF